MIRLIIRPEPGKHGGHAGLLSAWLGDVLIVRSRQPLLDGARALLAFGHDPATLMTTRQHDRDYDNFVPRPIGRLALLTASEEDRDGLRLRGWRGDQNGACDPAGRRRTREEPAGGGWVPGSADGSLADDKKGGGPGEDAAAPGARMCPGA
jgi:hypothetical protein